MYRPPSELSSNSLAPKRVEQHAVGLLKVPPAGTLSAKIMRRNNTCIKQWQHICVK